MTKTFDCPLLYEDNIVSRINLTEEKSPIAVIVETPELPPFPFSLFQSEEALNIDRAEAYAAAYQTKGTRPGDWQMLSAEQIQAVARNARAVQGTLLALESLAAKIDWGRYYLAARKSYDQYYLETVGIPCGKIFSIHNRGVDLVRLTIGKFNAVL